MGVWGNVAMIAASITLASGASGSVAQSDDDIIILGGSEHDEFIGCLTCSEYDRFSVWNSSSQYGWANSYGKWSKYGNHGSPYSSSSACNQYSSNGPILVDRRGNQYGRLSVNQYQSGSVCSPTGAPKICRALKVMCAAQ